MSIYKYKDVRKTLIRDSKRGPIIRPVSGITYLIIHHGATRRGQAGSNAESYAKYHVKNNGWRHIGYTWVIEPDGTTKRCLNNNEQGAHVGNHNKYSLGVCLVGDFTKEKPTAEQEKALRALVPVIMKEVPSIKYIRGHKEMPGASTACPAFDYKKVLSGSDPIPDEWKNLNPAPNGARFTRVLRYIEGNQMIGDDVLAVQEFLGIKPMKDKNGKPYGTYGPKTAKAVLEFRLKKGAKEKTSSVGPWTWEQMFGKKKTEPPKKDKFIRVQLNGKQQHAFGKKESAINWVKDNVKSGDILNIKR